MKTFRHLICQGILLFGINSLVIVASATWSWGESSFTGTEPFDQGFTVNPGMMAYNPRTLVVNFGEQNEVKYAKPSEEQTFDFDTLLNAPVDPEPDTAEPQPVPVDEPASDPIQQPDAIPEPSSLVLVGLGLLLVMCRIWRKNDRK